MQIQARPGRELIIRKVIELGEALSRSVDHTVADSLGAIIQTFRRESFTIAIMGKAKRGKSTLINALLGRTDDLVAPVDRLPASSAVSRFRYAAAEKATVSYREGRSEVISLDCIREYVTEESNPGNRKGVGVVEVEGPFPGLQDGLILVDTPGAASIHEHHDQLLHQFIPEADAVIFLVTARMPLDQDELDLLREIRVADIRKVFFAINRVDECSEGDLRDAINHNRQLLRSVGLAIDLIHPISARQAFRGQVGTSGLPTLATDVSAFIGQHRARVLEERFIARVMAVVEPTLRDLEFEMATTRKADVELREELESLRRRRGSIEATRDLAEREFLHAWNDALDRMEQALDVEQGRVRAELVRHVNGAGVLDIRKLADDLPTWLNRTIEDHLMIVGQSFEERARAACEKLQTEYPALGVQEGTGVVLRTRAGNELISGAIGGVALTATGIGVASAAGTAAAGIAAANAAALAATTTVSAPSLLASWLVALGFGELAPLATGTATVVAPAALTATPFWVALGGPVGWTLAGIGALAVPFSWHLSRTRLRDRLEAEGIEQVDRVFLHIRKDRLPALRKMARSIAGEFRLRLDRQIAGLEEAIAKAMSRPAASPQLDDRAAQIARIREILDQIRSRA